MSASATDLWNQLRTRCFFPLDRAPTAPVAEESPAFLERAEQDGWITPFQCEEIRAGRLEQLLVGNYCLKRELEHGPHGRVFLAEHVLLKQPAVVRLFSQGASIQRPEVAHWLRQVAAIASWNHETIVGVIDAGVLSPRGADTDGPNVYFVSPYVEGINLRQLVLRDGPLSLGLACEIIYPVAHALAEAHTRNLIHGSLGSSSVIRELEGRIRLVDFGLKTWPRESFVSKSNSARPIPFDPGIKQSDQVGIAQCLYWAFLGEEIVVQRDNWFSGKSLRSMRPDVPAPIEEMIQELLDPATRAEWSLARIQEALLPFVASYPNAPPDQACERAYPATVVLPMPSAKDSVRTLAPLLPQEKPSRRILIVDDESSIRSLCRMVLGKFGLLCDEAANGVLALKAATSHTYDLVLLDIDMPEMNGLEVCRQLRLIPNRPHLKVLLFSGRVESDELAPMLLRGADDFLTKPFSAINLQNRVQAALRFKQTQERTDLLTRDLLLLNRQMESHLNARDSDLVEARNALVLGLAKLAEFRDDDTGKHLNRVQKFSRRLAEEGNRHPAFASQIDRNFIDLLACCAPLHDIGKVGLPDHILLKPAKLDEEERRLMQTHTSIGADTLRSIAEEHGFALAFLQMAIDITRHHHERFDGTGYPDRLSGTAIPLSARIVALCDVYDALRSRRVYKPALPHATVLNFLRQGTGSHFDPALSQCFELCQEDFERIYEELKD